MGLGGEFRGEHSGDHHDKAVGQELRTDNSRLKTALGTNIPDLLTVVGVIKCADVSHLEVGGVHLDLEGVLLAEVQQAAAQVVDRRHSQSDARHDLLSVGLHVGRTGIQVGPVGEVGLGLGVDVEHPADTRRESCVS